MEGDLYIRICEAIKEELPDIHIHGFSPEEVLYGATRSRCSIKEYLQGLKDAGVGSLPGTSAEILDQELRDLIAPGRITTERWIEVITTAHSLGIPTTSTIMFGHVETNEHKARHIALIRDVQKASGGITEFVPLSFVHAEAPMHFQQTVDGLRSGATGSEVLKVHAIARIMLNNWIPNIQASWVKEGLRLSHSSFLPGSTTWEAASSTRASPRRRGLSTVSWCGPRSLGAPSATWAGCPPSGTRPIRSSGSSTNTMTLKTRWTCWRATWRNGSVLTKAWSK